MDYKEYLLSELERGFSKSDLERIIGLPQNNLSGVLSGDRNLSKKSLLKIEKFMAAPKLDPLDFIVKRNDKKSKIEILNQREVFIPKNQPVLDKFGRILVSEKKIKKEDTIEDIKKQYPLEPQDCFDKSEIEKQIFAIKAEKIPDHRNTTFGKKSWNIDQQKRISELKAKL